MVHESFNNDDLLKPYVWSVSREFSSESESRYEVELYDININLILLFIDIHTR